MHSNKPTSSSPPICGKVMVMTLLAIVRLRGSPDRRPEEHKALELLRLHKPYHTVIMRDTPSLRGMLKKTLEMVVTYGEINEETLALLLERRGRLLGNKRVTLEYVQKLGYKDFRELARALIEGKISLKDLPDFKPVFRLRPPSGGFKGTLKKHVGAGGELGYRGKAINDLIRRML